MAGSTCFPVCLGSFDQKAELEFVEWQCVGTLKEPPIEVHEVLHKNLREAAGVHHLPKTLESRFSVFRVSTNFDEKFGEAVFRDQFHILCKHGKQTAHKEAGDGFAVVALIFEAFTQFGQMNGNVLRDFGRCECRVEAERVGPDDTQKVAGFFVAQVVEKDSVAVAIWKLVVALPLPREISIKLNHMSYVHDQEEGRPAVFLGDRAGIIISLVAGLEHGVIPDSSAPNPVAGTLLLAVGGALAQIALAVFLLIYALLGFQHEMTATINVDETSAALVGVGKGDGTFKAIMVIRVIVLGGEWTP